MKLAGGHANESQGNPQSLALSDKPVSCCGVPIINLLFYGHYICYYESS